MRSCPSCKAPFVAAPILALVLLIGQAAPVSATLMMPGGPIGSEFTLGPTVPGKWGPAPLGTGAAVTWSLMPDGTLAPFDHVGGSTLFASILTPLGPGATAAITTAFTTWASVAILTFTQVGDTGLPWNNAGATGVNAGDIRFGAYAFDGVFGVLAHAFFPPVTGITAAGDAHFDMAEPWVLSALPEGSPTPGLIDWETVVLHELGHSLGLGHSGDATAVMFPFYSGVNRVLALDDTAGIQTLYGVIPEPASLLLMGSGLAGLAAWRRKLGQAWRQGRRPQLT